MDNRKRQQQQTQNKWQDCEKSIAVMNANKVKRSRKMAELICFSSSALGCIDLYRGKLFSKDLH